MKKYNVKNYIRHKEDIKRQIKSMPKNKHLILFTPEMSLKL